MVDISHKSNTLRYAKASAILQVGNQSTIQAILEDKVPKGNVIEMSKAAGLLAIKKTSDVIPDCHPLPIEFASIEFKILELSVLISVEVKTVYKTGVEVEAMHGASIVALTLYDMLKPIDKDICIKEIKLEEKQGGKSQYRKEYTGLKSSVVVCSDSIHKGIKKDKAGLVIQDKLRESGVHIENYEIIPDEAGDIIRIFEQEYARGVDLILFTGGTGLSPRDITPDTLRPMLDREIPGIAEAARAYGQQRIPYSMLSRSIAGVKGKTLVLTLPGSTNGAKETMDALFPYVLHIFNILAGARHEG